MEKYIDLETHVRPNDSMSLMTIKEMLEKYMDGYSKEAQVELVRCGECKYWQDNDSNYDYGYCYAEDGHGFGHAWGKNDFCSYGKRKE